MASILLQLPSPPAQFVPSPSNAAPIKGEAAQDPAEPWHQYEHQLLSPVENGIIAVPNQPSTTLVGDALTLAAELHGKTFHIPNLRETFADWPIGINQHLERLQCLVDKTLEDVVKNKRKLQALKRADFALLIALWYPDAAWEEIEIATYYSLWIFIWDDEVDAGDTSVSTDEKLAHAYSRQSQNFVHQVLSLNHGAGNQSIVDSALPHANIHPNMRLFAEVGAALKAGTDLVQRRRFYNELSYFMIQVGIEHSYRLNGIIPSVDKYLEIRSGSVGCAPQIAITDFMLKVRLPEAIMESAAMKTLWKETVVICLILNDVYSAQKEIAQGSLFNLIPVLFENLDGDERRPDAVIAQVMELLKTSMCNFETAAVTLTKLAAEGNAQVDQDTAAFIMWCRYFITGVLDWSLKSKRYGMDNCIQDDGSVLAVL
ncbi:isoprenoid synthase domain-containing protein [Stachybotrys elegans]|uniref:Terpene synthase n=1 Tax=Stachybotrys elegans TaxID=80388 RepID=A0A8K0WUZ6_9HYPO|nr:isoprenoid synthase domain-containing protein [Stachybotrys elegans]